MCYGDLNNKKRHCINAAKELRSPIRQSEASEELT